MTACEICWGDAYARARMLGGSQVEHYQALLAERAADHAEADALRPSPSVEEDDETGAESLRGIDKATAMAAARAALRGAASEEESTDGED